MNYKIENNINTANTRDANGTLMINPKYLEIKSGFWYYKGRMLISSRKHPEQLQMLLELYSQKLASNQLGFQEAYDEKAMVIGDDGSDDVSIWSKPNTVDIPKILKDQDKKKKKNKGGKKHKNKKHRHKQYEADIDRTPPPPKKLDDMKRNILDERKVDFTSLDATAMVSKYEFACSEGQLRCYSDKHGCYNALDKHEATVLIMKNISGRDQLRLKSGEADKIYKSLVIYPEIQKTLSGGIGTQYINCINGVFDVETGELLEHSKKYEFTHYINASYDENINGEHFMKFINEACIGKRKLMMLVQEVMGYAFSSYVNVKKAFIFYGPPNTGKSLILNIIQRIIGDNNVSHVTIQQLTNEYYLAKMLHAVINISADLPSEPIKDIGIFKSVVSGLDTVEAREIYCSPIAKACNCKQFYGSNNLIPLQNVGEPESFFNRLLIVPFNNVKAPEEQDANLSEKLFEERDFIFTWAMEGLMRLVENNFIFTHCKESEAVLERYKATYAPEVCFFNEYLEEAEGEKVSTESVRQRFLDYATEMDINVHGRDIQNYILSSHPKVKKTRKRFYDNEGEEKGRKKEKPNPIAAYDGLRFKK